MIQDISPHYSTVSDFWNYPGGRCGGAPLEFSKLIHSLQYSSDWAETWYDDTWHHSARGSELRNFLRTSIAHVSLSRRRGNLSPLSEMTAASVRRYFFVVRFYTFPGRSMKLTKKPVNDNSNFTSRPRSSITIWYSIITECNCKVLMHRVHRNSANALLCMHPARWAGVSRCVTHSHVFSTAWAWTSS